MRVFYFVFVCVCLYKYADGKNAPFITPCYAFDRKCITASAQRALPVVAAGVPALGIEVLDPMYIDRITSEINGVAMDLRENNVQGLKNCVMHEVIRTKIFLFMEMQCTINMEGDYTVGGKLLNLTVQGTGKYKIFVRDVLVKMSVRYDERDVNGVKYYTITNSTYFTNVIGGVEYNFQNLFNGDEALSDSVHKIANTHWGLVFYEVGSPIVDAIAGKIINEVKKLFDSVPANELSLS